MKLTPEQLKDILEEAKPSIIEGLKNDITNSITWDVKQVVGKEISTYTNEWVKTHIIPEIEKLLIESKEGIIQIGVGAAEDIVETLAKELTQELKGNLSNSWTRKKIFEALFD